MPLAQPSAEAIEELRKRSLNIWVVYEHPVDFPDDYVARLFVNGKATENVIRQKELGALRVLLAWNYPSVQWFPRHRDDEHQILELWM